MPSSTKFQLKFQKNYELVINQKCSLSASAPRSTARCCRELQKPCPLSSPFISNQVYKLRFFFQIYAQSRERCLYEAIQSPSTTITVWLNHVFYRNNMQKSSHAAFPSSSTSQNGPCFSSYHGIT